MLRILKNILFSIVVIMFVLACTGFNSSNRIVNDYYLIEVDTKNDMAIYYKTSSGEFINKIPPTVVEYGHADPFLVAKVRDMKGAFNYYIVNMKKDFDLPMKINLEQGH